MNSVQIWIILISTKLILSLSPEEFKKYHESLRVQNYDDLIKDGSTASPSLYYLPSPPLYQNYRPTERYTTLPHNIISLNKYPFNDILEGKSKIKNENNISNNDGLTSFISGWRNRDENYYRIGREKKWQAHNNRVNNLSSNDVKNSIIYPDSLNAIPDINEYIYDKQNVNVQKASRTPIIFRKKLVASLNVQDSPKTKTPGKVYKLPITSLQNSPIFTPRPLNNTNMVIIFPDSNFSTAGVSPMPASSALHQNNFVLPSPQEVLEQDYTTTSYDNEENKIPMSNL